MAKVVCLHQRRGVERQLVFDDWNWQSIVKAEKDDRHHVFDLSVYQAHKFFETHFAHEQEMPIELEFHRAYPKPFIAECMAAEITFDPRGWTLWGRIDIEQSIAPDMSWEGFEWLFNSGTEWLLLACPDSCEANERFIPTIEFSNQDQAAEFLRDFGKEIPKGLRGSGVLHPGDARGSFLTELNRQAMVGEIDLEIFERRLAEKENHKTTVRANNHEPTRMPQTPGELRCARDDALLNRFDIESETHPSYPELAEWLEVVAAAKSWTPIEPSSIRDALLRAWDRRNPGRPWPFDGRGKTKRTNMERRIKGN